MENNINRLFNKEFYKRILSVCFIIPLMIIPILYNQYLLFLVYLIINSLVIYEIDNMKNEKTTFIQTILVSLFVTFSFFIFIILLITDSTPTYKILEIIITIWLFDTFSFFLFCATVLWKLKLENWSPFIMMSVRFWVNCWGSLVTEWHKTFFT